MYPQLLINFATGHGRLRVPGSLDPSGREQLERRLADAVLAGCTRLELDCSQTHHLDVSSVLAIAAAKGELGDQGGALVVRDPCGTFARAARIAGREELVAAVTTQGGPRGLTLAADAGRRGEGAKHDG